MSNAGHIKFNWQRYLILAEELLNSIPENEDDEAKARTGISRAYYAAYHKAESYLNKIGITIDIYQKGSHKRVSQLRPTKVGRLRVPIRKYRQPQFT